MINRFTKLVSMVFAITLLSRCISVPNAPVLGGLYTGVTHSGSFTGGILDNNVSASKTGVSSCMSVLNLVAVGDCSEDTAKQNGGIEKVHSVTHKTTTVYIFFNKYETIVSGE